MERQSFALHHLCIHMVEPKKYFVIVSVWHDCYSSFPCTVIQLDKCIGKIFTVSIKWTLDR